MSVRRVALLGGSFNPVHLGHLRLARYVAERGLADEVWLMVSPCNPLKRPEGLLETEARLSLARLAAEGMPGVRVSDYETRLPLPSYTWRTLAALGADFPGTEFSLLVGTDNWLVFDRWRNAAEILRRHRLLVYPRPGYEVRAESLPPQVTLLSDAPQSPWSSTDIRRALAEGRDCAEMLPPAVAREIARRGYYGARPLSRRNGEGAADGNS